MTPRRAAAAPPVDVAEVRKNVMRLTVMQAILLAAVLGFFLISGPSDARGFRFLLWVALLPLGVGAWGMLYYRSVQRATAAGEGEGGIARASRGAIKVLGAFAGLWLVGLVVVLFI